jgi:hypothetical protein
MTSPLQGTLKISMEVLTMENHYCEFEVAGELVFCTICGEAFEGHALGGDVE